MSIWATDQINTDRGIVERTTTTLHRGQAKIMRSNKRFVVALAGTQGGKTTLGPLWLKREVDRCGVGDYLAGTATNELFGLKMLPAMREVFETIYGLGTFKQQIKIIQYHDDPTRIILRSAEGRGSFESTTAKAVWLDEAGLKSFTLHIWEGVLRRLSLNQGRVLITTTIYNLNPGHWLKSKLYDPWVASGRNHPDIDIIQFDSRDNPAFPIDEWNRAEQSMPRWRFNMFYRGLYERPVGMIYDCFSARHIVPSFVPPPHWNWYMGQDYGGTNMAAVIIAGEVNSDGEATGRYFVCRTYKDGGKTVRQHANAMIKGLPVVPFTVGGSQSEDNWRREFRLAGIPVSAPRISSVDVGIQRTYSMFKRNQLFIMDSCDDIIDEIQAYAHPVDADGNVIETKIEDKEKFHLADALRYICSRIGNEPHEVDRKENDNDDEDADTP